VDLAHQLDPTRPAGIGGCQRGDLDKLGDVAGYNGDGAHLFIDPGIPNVVTEYGSTIADRPANYDGNLGEVGSQPEFKWRSGQSLWCAFDYGTIFGHFGAMGFVDYFRIPKRSWYWYRNEYAHVPPPEWPQPGTPAKLQLTTDKTTIEGTDGTDDCQLLVTVQDEDGKAISNSPPVTLTIESGPGEFPTGRSIIFNPKSDIVIRDGQAAIEFRSYYGGNSVIRATSPGLEDAQVTITTEGIPVFVPGQSPLASNLPYVRFINSNGTNGKLQNIALSHPASASSEAPQHTADLAIDDDAKTSWQAADNDSKAWWQVDLEGLYSIESVRLTFGSNGNYQYKVEASPDGDKWNLLIDQTRGVGTDQIPDQKCADNSHNRFLRITFTGLPPSQSACLQEVKIEGTPTP
jgi:beta-galactosidase